MRVSLAGQHCRGPASRVRLGSAKRSCSTLLKAKHNIRSPVSVALPFAVTATAAVTATLQGFRFSELAAVTAPPLPAAATVTAAQIGSSTSTRISRSHQKKHPSGRAGCCHSVTPTMSRKWCNAGSCAAALMLLLVASHVEDVSAAACQAWQLCVAEPQITTCVPSNSSNTMPAGLNATCLHWLPSWHP